LGRALTGQLRSKIAASGRNVPAEGTFLPLVEILTPEVPVGYRTAAVYKAGRAVRVEFVPDS
jgi:hypothetical protein